MSPTNLARSPSASRCTSTSLPEVAGPEYQVGPFCRKGLLCDDPVKGPEFPAVPGTIVLPGRKDLLLGDLIFWRAASALQSWDLRAGSGGLKSGAKQNLYVQGRICHESQGFCLMVAALGGVLLAATAWAQNFNRHDRSDRDAAGAGAAASDSPRLRNPGQRQDGGGGDPEASGPAGNDIGKAEGTGCRREFDPLHAGSACAGYGRDHLYAVAVL